MESKDESYRHPISPTVKIRLNGDNPTIHFEKNNKCWVTGDDDIKKEIIEKDVEITEPVEMEVIDIPIKEKAKVRKKK